MTQLTHAQMIDLLGVAIDPVNPEKVPRSLRITLLQAAMATMIPLLRPHVVACLKTAQTSIPLDYEGAFDMATLTTEIWEQAFGIDLLRQTDNENTVYLLESQEEFNRNLERYFVYDPTAPKYHVYGSKIYCNPYPTLTTVASGSIAAGTTYYVTGYTSVVYNGVTVATWGSFLGVAGVPDYEATGTGYVSTTNTLVNLYYRKQPTAIAETGTPTFPTRMQKVIIGLACEEYNANKYKLALAEIDALNRTAAPTSSDERPFEFGGEGEKTNHTIFDDAPDFV